MEATSLAPLKILVVEDSAHMRDLLKALLGAMGIEDVILASDGEEGHALFLETGPDIIITDGAMSPTDGYELTDRIRKDPDNPKPYVPIIMLSGHLEEERVQRARATGVTEYLAKPISTDTLYERLVAIVGNPSCFIRTPSYLGPDRRRQTDALYHGPERRVASPEVTERENVIPFDPMTRHRAVRNSR